ncbi:pyruvate, phosphate dikinase [Nisaea acidiphila]|uniref:Pyruvate, phosphate dikinase n=1 Tax=Nisaea acidiphila TaxID=1862145 RepID=A0A9J7ARV0_9PROT|nr:pyruvate, phosphate dikinase [Nisaea acidiphila]UUX50347.1 pyruvate, phosphate dikinase [Nisaea acidiphila]
MAKWVYNFGAGKADGSAQLRELLGGKGANLAEMASLGLPVPPGFTISTEVCTHYYANGRSYPTDLESQAEESLKAVEAQLGRGFGSTEKPLLVSVRSGARASMPGMMDTVLNLGLNDDTAAALARETNDERFAYDSFRRFIQMYSDVVLEVEHYNFEEILEEYKDIKDYNLDTEMTADDWKQIVKEYKARVKDVLGRDFPADPKEQLWGAISAVFGSWMNQRANTYRRLHGIPEEWGTAVTVQSMVFGNMGNDCSTGVCFSRNPSTGDNHFYGEFLVNAQGEDVVAGIRTPQPLTLAERENGGGELPSMEETQPEVFKELCAIREKLEGHYRDMQDMEFTVQQNRLWILQTRNGKRTAKAALKIACDLVREGVIDKREAIKRIDPAQLDQLLHPTLDPSAERDVVGRGLPASPGAASGQIVFTADEAEEWSKAGKKVVLVRNETSPEDIGGMHVAEGILTTRGGMTSHAAVVARGMGTPCVSGAGEIKVDGKNKVMLANGREFAEGDVITLDGTTGEVMSGEVATIKPELTGDFGELMGWVDEFRTLGVRANAETPLDAQTAVDFGAEGIGLSRTEHMFFDPERIVHMREMILARDPEARRAAIAKLLPYQREDFTALFRIMNGLPATIRLLDPPLNEFLPHTEEEMQDVADAAGVSLRALELRKAELDEANPMLGHRGCRLAVTYPEICEMQARAIFEAVVAVKKDGIKAIPEVMIPLVGTKAEMDDQAKIVHRIADAVKKESGEAFEYMVGTMIELPRACMVADEIAETAEFFSFGTNDLTQTTFGFSRDDAGTFIEEYLQRGLLPADPFITIDRDGVGGLVRMGAEKGKKTRPDLKMGICGEHGGDPESVRFCHEVGLTYVSCSPYRVPIARLAAAQAAIDEADAA